MSTDQITWSVFTKAWKMPLPELGKFVKGLGFEAIELPVRPGYQVPPEQVSRGLPAAVSILADCGIKIASVAGPTDEKTIAACAEAGVPIIRICVEIPPSTGYLATEAQLQKEYDALVPVLGRHGLTIGIQNHCGRCVGSAMGVRHLIEKYNPRQFGAVLDFAHCALAGEEPDLAVDIVCSHLCMVNLKNGIWQRTNGPEAEVAGWKVYWTSGRQGLASWPDAAAALQKHNYNGVICVTAEYSDHSSVNRLVAEDLAFAKSLFRA
jgi:sugar phosphate isomerase/epimerase